MIRFVRCAAVMALVAVVVGGCTRMPPRPVATSPAAAKSDAALGAKDPGIGVLSAKIRGRTGDAASPFSSATALDVVGKEPDLSAWKLAFRYNRPAPGPIPTIRWVEVHLGAGTTLWDGRALVAPIVLPLEGDARDVVFRFAAGDEVWVAEPEYGYVKVYPKGQE